MAIPTSDDMTLLSQFELEKVLNQAKLSILDQAGLRTILLGNIRSESALLILERAAFPSMPALLSQIPAALINLTSLGVNEIYHWYLANSPSPPSKVASSLSESTADIKINLIYPCTEQHIKKYSKQSFRMIGETPQIYHNYVQPFILRKRQEGHLTWVWNIIEGKTEVENVIYRTPQNPENIEGFLLLPDLNWDRKTMENLHLLGLVERRDLWTLRDLKKKHVGWLKNMRKNLINETLIKYEGLEVDQLILYVHYQPTYYHFHIHIVHIALEAGVTQAVGKAIGLESIIEQLEHMNGDQELGMDSLTLHYRIGEASELWTEIFEPIKTGEICKDPLPQ
ncbi:BgTH12-04810 [Blumeria graminis f. sp. triticale]|uniref:BgTH12-04810 n=1 Tax=Blumeria graminis f. sp. triticale TaxID=1689686 RepID=A0A9W4CUT7_BLUGR|nr:BgTH12-04810 [Blumeria graminis f. sp. triticale]